MSATEDQTKVAHNAARILLNFGCSTQSRMSKAVREECEQAAKSVYRAFGEPADGDTSTGGNYYSKIVPRNVVSLETTMAELRTWVDHVKSLATLYLSRGTPLTIFVVGSDRLTSSDIDLLSWVRELESSSVKVQLISNLTPVNQVRDHTAIAAIGADGINSLHGTYQRAVTNSLMTVANMVGKKTEDLIFNHVERSVV